MVREEHGNRLEVTSADGEVAHRPGPLEAFVGWPYVEAAPGVLLHPRLARRHANEWRVAGGWRIPWGGPLQPSPRPAPTDDPKIPPVGLPLSEVICLRRHSTPGHKDQQIYWHTDRGVVRGGEGSLKRIAASYGLMCITQSFYANPRRLRAIRCISRDVRRGLEYLTYQVVLDGDQDIAFSETLAPRLGQALGLSSLRDLDPDVATSRALYHEGLRDFPFDLATASAALLRRHFQENERRLIANVVWQSYRARRAGQPKPWGVGHRGFWYRPLVDILARAGFIATGPTLLEASQENDPHYLLYQNVLIDLVGTYRLFTYHDIGFGTPRPDMRRIGDRLPNVVVVVEKDTVMEGVEALSAAYGPSWIVMGGQSHLIAVEGLVDALRGAGVTGPLLVVAYVDYDPSGHAIGTGFVRHLERYGMPVEAIGWLVTPDRFTAAEISRHAIKIVAPGDSRRGVLREWMRATHGIGGKPLGLHADLLRPAPRVLEAFEDVMRGLGRRVEREG